MPVKASKGRSIWTERLRETARGGYEHDLSSLRSNPS